MKNGFSLSINMIVMLILGIAVLAMSLVLVKNIFIGSENFKETLDKDMERELNSLLDDGSIVSIPFIKQQVQKNDLVQFGVGVYNVVGEARNFTLLVTGKNVGGCNSIRSGSQNDPVYISDRYYIQTVQLDNTEKFVYPLFFKIHNNFAVDGCTYVFDVRVASTGSSETPYTDAGSNPFPINNPDHLYDKQIHKLYLTVKG